MLSYIFSGGMVASRAISTINNNTHVINTYVNTINVAGLLISSSSFDSGNVTSCAIGSINKNTVCAERVTCNTHILVGKYSFSQGCTEANFSRLNAAKHSSG